MANPQGRVLPFPRRPSPIPAADYQAQNAQGDAELRAALLRELLEDLTSHAEHSTDRLRIRLATLAANDLLDELVVLYRRALSQLQGRSSHE
ncbi:hypothetical protein BVH03_02595 [Pseudomonas sp. PA15(2017)]|uniref:hypothetical protein n=1 Tax=Pseudomonas sp. PA15(2017) TaxID=1932111 RepID=UPI000969B6FE|nr:hypothetical protein [Pseudomonas sp. PA15(2017)]OLU34320.1 hypothetical protein BVH03_02595 [Pseudomonas sp. PA15(2017)]